MSFDTWLDKFYPLEAYHEKVIATDKTAVEHCIVKWEGLRPDNIQEHGMKVFGRRSLKTEGENTGFFSIDASTCALCTRNSSLGNYGCWGCPIYSFKDLRDCSKEYTEWIENKDPEPMIDLLKRTLKMVEENEHKTQSDVS